MSFESFESMSTCLIHSQAMRYSDPTHPSPEMEIIAQAAQQLFENKKADAFVAFANTTIGGVHECDVLKARLLELGIPESILTIQPIADTTDGEFEAFMRYAQERSMNDTGVSVLSIEAKRGRLEKIADRSNFFPHIFWAEDVLAESSREDQRRLVNAWRASSRHWTMRFRLGLLPLAFMKIDPQTKIQRSLARYLRHQG